MTEKGISTPTQHQKSNPRNETVDKKSNPSENFKNTLSIFQEISEKPLNRPLKTKNSEDENENLELKVMFTEKVCQIKPRSPAKPKIAQKNNLKCSSTKRTSQNPPSKSKSENKANSTLSPAKTTTNQTYITSKGLTSKVKSSTRAIGTPPNTRPITAFFKPKSDATKTPSKSESRKSTSPA